MVFCMIPTAMNHPPEQQRLWKKIGDAFRKACLMKRQGLAGEAGVILDQELPKLIAQWSRTASLPESAKRKELEELFAVEQRRVDDAWMIQNILFAQLRDVLIPSLCLQVTEEVRDLMENHLDRKTDLEEAVQEPAASAVRSASDLAVLDCNELCSTVEKVVNLPVPVRHRMPAPGFDDIPAIIDTMLEHEPFANTPHAAERMVALV